MSRAGRAAAAALAPTPEEAPAPAEVPADVERQLRAHRLYGLCKAQIVHRSPPLWPPEVVGMNIAEQWLQNLTRRIQEAAIEQMRARGGALVLPS